MDHWNGGLRTTGGALDPKKTHWYLLDFLWRHGIWSYAGLDNNNKLTMLDPDDNRVDLQQLPVHIGMRTLGVILAPDGNNKDQLAALLDKAEQWADLISTGHLDRKEAWRALNSTILKALEYPLTATTLTQEETTKIFAPIRQAALPASGIVRTFPTAIAHAPLKYQGLAIPDLYATQQTKHIMTLLKFGGTNTVTGNLIQQSIELLKIEIGISRPLHEISITKVEQLATNSWVKTTWMFMEKYFFHINEEPQFMLRRENDGYLMELIYESQIPKANWRAINRCRLYHKVLTLSDIITGNGDKIRQEIWTDQGVLTMDDRDNWPNQGNPSKSDWQIWRQSLKTLFQLRAQDSAIELQFQLGAGQVTSSWKWYCDEDRLYEENKNTVTVYSQYGTRRSRRKNYRLSNTIPARPLQALPCTVERHRNNIVMTGKIIPEKDEVATGESNLSFINYLQKKLKASTCPEQLIWMIYDNDPPSEEQMQQLKDSMEKDELIGCTDASTKNGISTASFKFQTKNKITVLQGEVLVPGDQEIQCSHRGEMGGAAAALTYLQLIVEYKNIQKGSVRFGCDSDNVVNIGLRQTSESNSITEHYDLVRRCREARKAIQPVRIVPVNVKGHTDTLYRKKTTMEKLNIECDKRAGRRWQQAIRENQQPEASQIGYWQLYHQGDPVLTQVPEKIRTSIQEYTAYEYWTEKNYNPLKKNKSI